jgi:hypothetical protein
VAVVAVLLLMRLWGLGRLCGLLAARFRLTLRAVRQVDLLIVAVWLIHILYLDPAWAVYKAAHLRFLYLVVFKYLTQVLLVLLQTQAFLAHRVETNKPV